MFQVYNSNFYKIVCVPNWPQWLASKISNCSSTLFLVLEISIVKLFLLSIRNTLKGEARLVFLKRRLSYSPHPFICSLCTDSRAHTLNWASGGPVIITILTFASGASAGAIWNRPIKGLWQKGDTNQPDICTLVVCRKPSRRKLLRGNNVGLLVIAPATHLSLHYSWS